MNMIVPPYWGSRLRVHRVPVTAYRSTGSEQHVSVPTQCVPPASAKRRSFSFELRRSPCCVVNPDEVIEKSRDHPHKKHATDQTRRIFHQSWRRDEDAARAPKYKMPSHGIPSKSAYQLLHDELCLDGNPTLNLASSVQGPSSNEVLRMLIMS